MKLTAQADASRPVDEPFHRRLVDYPGSFFPSLRTAAGSVIAILLIASFWRLVTFRNPEPAGYDETVYCLYAQAFGESGWEGLRTMLRDWSGSQFLGRGPLPFRVFFIVPGAWACKLLGGYTAGNLALLSWLFGLATVPVALLLARRWLGPAQGFLAALLMVFSPLATALSMRGLQDSCFAFVVAIAVLLYDRCWRERRPLDLWLLGLALAAGFLTKESMAFLYPSFAVAGLCYARAGARWRPALVVPFVAAPLAHLAVVAWLSGGLQAAVQTYRAYAAMQEANPYTRECQSGPWFRYAVDFILVSPLVALLAVVGAARSSPRPGLAAGRNLAGAYLLSGLAVFSLLPLLNLRIVLFLDLFIRALAVVGLFAFCERWLPTPRMRLAGILLLAALVVAGDIAQFASIFVAGGVYDPTTDQIIRANGFMR